jgi:hypothetical protein
MVDVLIKAAVHNDDVANTFLIPPSSLALPFLCALATPDANQEKQAAILAPS